MKNKTLLVIGAIMLAMIGLVQPVFAKAESANNPVALPTPTPAAGMARIVETVEENDEVREEYSDGSWSVQYRGKSAEEVIKELGLEGQVTFIASYSKTDEPTMQLTRDSYETRILDNTRVYYSNTGAVMAVLEEAYTVYYYTSNKVHLFTFSLDIHGASDYLNSRVVYGEIENTDGSLSYISGTYAELIGNGTTERRPINFIVTPTYHNFYE